MYVQQKNKITCHNNNFVSAKKKREKNEIFLRLLLLYDETKLKVHFT